MSQRFWSRAGIGACTLLLLALVATACVPGVPTTASGPKTVLIGAALPLTGDVAPDGNGQKNGYDLWKDTVNAQGGISVGGEKYKVDIKYYDYKSDTTTAVKLIEKLITEDKVQFIFGPFGSGATEAASAVTEKYQIPLLAPSANAAPIYSKGYKYIFGILGPPTSFAEHTMNYVAALNPKPASMAIISRNDLFPLSTAKAFEAAAKSRNIEVVYFETYNIGATDLSTNITGAKNRNPDIVLGTGYINDLVLLTKQANELRLAPKMFIQSDGPANPAFVESLSSTANNVVTPAWWAPVVPYVDETKVFESAADYTAKFTAQYGQTPGYVSAASSVIGEILQVAIQKAGTTDPVKVREHLAVTDLRTFFGTVRFNEGGQNVGSTPVVLQIQNQQLVAVAPEGAATGSVVYPAVWQPQ